MIEPSPPVERVAVSRMTLFGGQEVEVVTVDREFLAAALYDALAWCRRPRVAPDPDLGAAAAGYEAALAIIRPPAPPATPVP